MKKKLGVWTNGTITVLVFMERPRVVLELSDWSNPRVLLFKPIELAEFRGRSTHLDGIPLFGVVLSRAWNHAVSSRGIETIRSPKNVAFVSVQPSIPDNRSLQSN